jgi:hypothetical protein
LVASRGGSRLTAGGRGRRRVSHLPHVADWELSDHGDAVRFVNVEIAATDRGEQLTSVDIADDVSGADLSQRISRRTPRTSF